MFVWLVFCVYHIVRRWYRLGWGVVVQWQEQCTINSLSKKKLFWKKKLTRGFTGHLYLRVLSTPERRNQDIIKRTRRCAHKTKLNGLESRSSLNVGPAGAKRKLAHVAKAKWTVSLQWIWLAHDWHASCQRNRPDKTRNLATNNNIDMGLCACGCFDCKDGKKREWLM